MFGLKLKAGALQLTIFIVVVIALLLASFILLVYTHKQFQVQSDFIIEATKNADRGIDYTLLHTISTGDTTIIDLKDEDFKTLYVHRDFWGVFEKVTSVSQIKNNRFKKVALVGSQRDKNNRTALYLQDNNKPLVLVGNTKIEGIAFLPKQGVKTGFISGEGYYGSKLIYGQTKTASQLPEVFSETIDYMQSIENKILRTTQNQYLDINRQNKFSNSFFDPIQIVFSNEEIDLREVELTGHILIQSKTKIAVYPSSTLKDVVLIAPEIEIINDVKGNFQAIASKEILVGTNVELEYPSALIVNEKESVRLEEDDSKASTEHNRIVINDYSTIKGLVMFRGIEMPNNYKTQISMTEKSIVSGEVYCNQNLELLGTVYGTVYTNNFLANQAGSIYQNHIYNGTILANELPKEFSGLAFRDSKKKVLKWLY
jgi:hypothetical protein